MKLIGYAINDLTVLIPRNMYFHTLANRRAGTRRGQKSFDFAGTCEDISLAGYVHVGSIPVL